MKHTAELNEVQAAKIRMLAERRRQDLGYLGNPIAAEIFEILDRLNITLLQFPVESGSELPAFSAAMLYSKIDGEVLVFIGLNAADYFDKQVFAIAHELYHFFTKTGSHLSRADEESTQIEAEANRFAAEFLLPEPVLKDIVISEFDAAALRQVPLQRLMRFVARLHCSWWLLYRSLVKRLKEIDAISSTQYEGLYSIDERDPNGYYMRMGMAINEPVFSKLNSISRAIDASPRAIEAIIRNYAALSTVLS
ncbi:MAG TPA: ImmA/IrrE family metallo-endopeptidase [Firmicutes bacterium]|jgi:Zn-dependent peptidase ImmA (M78 family)|nr:ImmA/IrrE family metallo-endopeptidase [Bacillota bacterium]